MNTVSSETATKKAGETSTAAEPSANSSHELDAPPWLRVESTIMAAARALRSAYDCHLAQFDLNLNTASTLAYVNQHGPITQTAIADGLGHGRAATGGYVDRLEERSLVERQADKDDRRVWLVAATEAGRNLMVDVAKVDKQLRVQLRTGIDRDERQMLADVLVRLKANLEHTNDSAGPHHLESP